MALLQTQAALAEAVAQARGVGDSDGVPLVNDLRDIPGWEGMYAASEDGHIWSHDRHWTSGQGARRSYRAHWLSEVISNMGYYRARLFFGDCRRYVQVHRLVALAWLPNPLGLPQVNHKNLDRLQNATTNLEWCTHAYNLQHASAHGRMIAPHRRKLTMEQAQEVRRRHAQGEGTHVLGAAFGLDSKGIWCIVNDKSYKY